VAKRPEYRAQLEDKLLALEDGGYGDFEYTSDQLDTYLDLACIRMWPAVYKKVAAWVPGASITNYGSAGLGYVLDTAASGVTKFPIDRVYAVDDASEYNPILEWRTRADRLVDLDSSAFSAEGLIVYYYDPYDLPDNDEVDANIPKIYDGLINLGALIEACESRQDTGVRGEPQPTGQFAEVALIDRLTPRYERLREALELSLPAVNF